MYVFVDLYMHFLFVLTHASMSLNQSTRIVCH